MGILDGLLNQVKDAITQHTSNPQTFDPSKLMSHITDLFTNHPSNTPGKGIKPASQDPYGDPANSK